MKKKFIFILFLLPFILPGQCFEGGWDISTERVCLDTVTSTFTYIHDSPLGDDDTISGSYITKGDTLIFNPGQPYDTISIVDISMNTIPITVDKHQLMVVGIDGMPLKNIEFKAGKFTYRTNEVGLAFVSKPFPADIFLRYASIQSNLIPNPISPFGQHISVGLPDDSSHYFIKIQLDIQELKAAFEGESQAVLSEQGLELMRYNGQALGLILKPQN